MGDLRATRAGPSVARGTGMPRVGPTVVLVAVLSSALFACTAFEATNEKAAEGKPPAGQMKLDGTASGAPAGSEVAPAGSAAPATSDVPPLKTTPEDVCTDYIEVLGKATARCNDEPEALFALLGEALTGPDCESVTKVRDVKSLYAECLPWCSRASCTDLGDSAKVPAACKDQLVE